MRHFISLLIISKILSIEIFADGCTLPLDCEDKEFPYTFCNSNNLLHKCSKNPYDEWDGTTKLKPMKLDGCFEYDALTYTFEYKTIVWDETGIWEFHTIIGYDASGNPIFGYKTDVPIYNPGTDKEIPGYNEGDPILEPYDIHIMHHTDQITANKTINNNLGDICFNYYKFNPSDYPGTNDNFDNALSSWSNFCLGCDLNNEYMQHCCVKISWSKKKELFAERGFDPSEIPAFTSMSMLPPSIEPCNYDCEKIFVIINQTDDFTGNTASDPGNYSRHFFITGESNKNGWYSMSATLMHEMGHLFGFGDQYDDDGLDCDHSESVMDGTDFENPDRGLSDDDKCMYMKIYCWDPPTHVEDDNETLLSIKVFPNPTNLDLINIQFGNPLGIKMSYEILSPIGQQILTGNIFPGENQKTIILGNLASGVYYITLKQAGMKESKLFVIGN